MSGAYWAALVSWSFALMMTRLRGVGEAALRLVGGLCGDGGADILEAEAVAAQLGGIDVDPHRRGRAASDQYLAHTADLREALFEYGRGGVVQRRWGQFVRGQRNDHDGRVRRVDLAIGGIAGKIRGQIAAGGVDRRFDVTGRRIDAAAQVELQRDVHLAQGALRGHLGDRRNPAELPFERRGDGGCHDLRARSRQGGLHRDGGKSTCGSGDTGNTRNAATPDSTSAMVSSVVAMGRRMKGREKFMRAAEPAATRGVPRVDRPPRPAARGGGATMPF